MPVPKPVAAASLAALFPLTACTGGGSMVFDFTETVTEPASSIEFRVPDELVELSDSYARDRVYESVTVTALEPEGSSQCAVEYEFDFVDGGLERLVERLEEVHVENDSSEEELVANVLTGEPSGEVDLAEDYRSAVVPLDCASSPTDDEATVRVALTRLTDTDTRSFARAELAVMQGGEIYIHEPEVMDWHLDSNGNWIQ